MTAYKYLINNIRGDKIIWLVVFGLSAFSILAVYSSTGMLAYKQQDGNTEYYVIKHAALLFAGIGMMYLAHLVSYKYYSRFAQIILYISIPLLFYTLVFGSNLNEAARWITLPVINLTFQTSDLARFALIMYTARMLSKKQEQIKGFKEAFVPIILPIVLTCALIFPANLSTAAVLFFTCMLLMFIGRVNLKYIALTFGSGIAVLALVIALSYVIPDVWRFGTWQNRVESFIDGNGEEEYQVEQAKIAIANGGIFGLGPGNSQQRNTLPHPYSDFIYAIVIEEYGLFGGIIIIVLYLVLLYRCIRIVAKAPNSFGAFLATGLGLSLTIQAFINMGVATNVLPVTGLTLPMLSMGGTSIWFTSISVGIILSVSREIEIQELKNTESENEDILNTETAIA
ncbi:MAG: cell division protein FtsW [Bacteroidetes bacterium]|nr:cell division protein FtsW [Bacteroidota bacterium]MBP8754236.1 cell division protein FtsW [Chitinophagales bacterium]MBK7109178.1 cell division protein FtsW [Bacteroidota bacterium]MBK8488502.1 cell division protein FtsW [Bacteroidota bacterium]MBK8681736.1 cell division protein FtsW [Bacteroidota bacterium]